jgi:hypothetical protein
MNGCLVLPGDGPGHFTATVLLAALPPALDVAVVDPVPETSGRLAVNPRVRDDIPERTMQP